MLETEPVGYVSRLHQFPALQLALRLCRCDDDGLAKHVTKVPVNKRLSCGAHDACWAVECVCGEVTHAGQYPVACGCGAWYVGDRLAVYAIRLPGADDGE